MKKTMLIIFAVCALSAGCSTVNTVEPAKPQSVKKMVDDKRIITDTALDGYAYIAGVNESTVGGDLLKVQVQIVNATVALRQVNYRFEWLDESGMAIGSPNTPWLTLSLEGGESKYISSVAPSPRAKDFSLKLLGNVRD